MPDATAGRRPAGELEASVLAALWAAGGRPLTPADVQRDLDAALNANLARTTVTTILARLHEKGSVSRTRSGRGYAYLPVQDSPGLAARRMRTELDKSARDDRGVVLARFVSELGPDDEALLRSLLASGAEDAAEAADAAADAAHAAEAAHAADAAGDRGTAGPQAGGGAAPSAGGAGGTRRGGGA
jgi:predicted transcriptional regulator